MVSWAISYNSWLLQVLVVPSSPLNQFGCFLVLYFGTTKKTRKSHHMKFHPWRIIQPKIHGGPWYLDEGSWKCGSAHPGAISRKMNIWSFGSGIFPTQILGHLLSIPSQNRTLFEKCFLLCFFWDLKRITVSSTIIIQKCAPKTFAPPKTNSKFTPEMWWLNSFPVWL